MTAGWSRRRMLGAALGLAGAGGLAALGPRATSAAPLSAATGARRGAADAAGSGAALIVVQDGRYAASRRHAAALAPQAARVLEARSDLARQWYGGLRSVAARAPLNFSGLTTWSDFLVMRGCAAECGLRAATHELLRDAGGAGCTLVRWQIGAAPA
ncbi:MAG: hypothetical protein IT480_13960 [Gammaproteobacteria bacterium]|nr:hypothetical protein [Gammaproteobacteria bacterium]